MKSFRSVAEEISRRDALDDAQPGFNPYSGQRVTTTETLYHGGMGGFDVADTLLPPSQTGYLRPQVAIAESGVPVHWLENKSTYRGDRVYATRDLNLALNHASGWTNWSALTGAADILPRFGAVYEVKPVNCILELDYSVACCCLRIHSRFDFCQFRARRFTVVKVIEREVPAVANLDWRLALKNLNHAYQVWKEQKGSDWYERNLVR